MTSYTLADTDLNSLAGKTILIIGAATGVGRAAVDIAIGEKHDVHPAGPLPLSL
jgi:NADPH:quinone reductase-like Zn-dependent oxidoreductase